MPTLKEIRGNNHNFQLLFGKEKYYFKIKIILDSNNYKLIIITLPASDEIIYHQHSRQILQLAL
jgi:hypothetical protein